MEYEKLMAQFDAVRVKNDIVKWIRDWFAENGRGRSAVIGVSGGKDSSIVAALCVEALGKDRVIGVLMPQGEQKDIGDALALVGHLGIEHIVVNIENAVHTVLYAIYKGFAVNQDMPLNFTRQTEENLPPRVRMATLYAVSQTLNGRVANTCNLSEDWVGYSTRWGDSVGDFSPLAMLTTDEVIAVGKACGLPVELVEKVPADGLCGKTDEENLGFSYRVLNEYIRTGECADAAVKQRIDEKHQKNLFKMRPMPVFEYA